MIGVPAVYLGQIVDKKHFRTFVYGADGSKKLVESWDDYENHMESGLWFSTQEDALRRVPVEKPKRIRNKTVPVITLELKDNAVRGMSLDCSVKDNDFISKKGE